MCQVDRTEDEDNILKEKNQCFVPTGRRGLGRNEEGLEAADG